MIRAIHSRKPGITATKSRLVVTVSLVAANPRDRVDVISTRTGSEHAVFIGVACCAFALPCDVVTPSVGATVTRTVDAGTVGTEETGVAGAGAGDTTAVSTTVVNTLHPRAIFPKVTLITRTYPAISITLSIRIAVI